MPEQDSTVNLDEFGYAEMSPTITQALVRRSADRKRANLLLGTASNRQAATLSLPDKTWSEVIPLLIERMSEPFRSEVIAAVTQIGAEAVSA